MGLITHGPYDPRALRPEVFEGPGPFFGSFKLPLVPPHGLIVTDLLQKPRRFCGQEITKAPGGTPREPKGVQRLVSPWYQHSNQATSVLALLSLCNWKQ